MLVLSAGGYGVGLARAQLKVIKQRERRQGQWQ